MNKYHISVYPSPINKGQKKSEIEVSKICKSIASYKGCVDINELSDLVEKGYVWCPATFTGERKKQDELDSIQIFALDFDGGISLTDALNRAEKYRIPVSLYYETMSSENYFKFRFVFICNQEVTYKNLAILISYCLCTIFPEADQTSKDFSKLYFPGRNSVCNGEIKFSIYDLLISTIQFLDENCYANKVKKIKQIASKSHIVLMNNIFHIEQNPVIYKSVPPSSFEGEKKDNNFMKNRDSDDFMDITIYNNMVNSTDSSIITYKIFFSERNQCFNTGKKNFEQKITRDFSEICPLLNDFTSGVRLAHHEWFGLMLNLIQLNGGKKIFTEVLQKYENQYGDIQRKFAQLQSAVKSNYHAAECDNFCPYSNTCIHESNLCRTLKIAGKRIIFYDDNISYSSIEKMREKLRDNLEHCINSSDINVIKAPTGSGKTYAVLQAVKHADRQCIMALPNAKLMHEMEATANKMGISCMAYPVIEDLLEHLSDTIVNEIRYAYTIGDDMSVNFLLRDCNVSYAADYLEKIRNANKFKGQLVLITHARFLNLKEDYLSTKNIIIDEDILPVMMQIKSVSKKEMINFVYNLEHEEFSVSPEIMKKLKSIVDVHQYEFLPKISDDVIFYEKALLKKNIDAEKWSSNLFHALSSHCFYHSSESDEIFFLFRKNFPACNCTILSATADKSIYENIFDYRLNAFYDLGYLQYKGKLLLHSDYTYSRDCFRQNPDLMQEIRKRHSDCDVIPFKEYAKYNEIYLGVAQGLNYLQGRNLVVAGTFHRPDYVYKLWYMEILKNIPNDIMARRRVKRNGFSFPIMTFSSSFLQSVQLYMIESELEQAVGRARLVNYDCTVHLYSNFPLRQCLIDKVI